MNCLSVDVGAGQISQRDGDGQVSKLKFCPDLNSYLTAYTSIPVYSADCVVVPRGGTVKVQGEFRPRISPVIKIVCLHMSLMCFCLRRQTRLRRLKPSQAYLGLARKWRCLLLQMVTAPK